MSDQAEIDEILQALDPVTRTIVAEIDMGIQAKQFFESDLGKYIVGCCQQEIAEAHEKLESVAWWNRRRIKQLQNQAWRARSMVGWLAGLIGNGKSAENSLAEREE